MTLMALANDQAIHGLQKQSSAILARRYPTNATIEIDDSQTLELPLEGPSNQLIPLGAILRIVC
jgi:hypothetical protein